MIKKLILTLLFLFFTTLFPGGGTAGDSLKNEVSLEKINIKYQQATELKSKYQLDGASLKATPKDDPKDRIEVEIGDVKQDKFCPQGKIKRWDDEVNLVVRLINDEKTPTVSIVGNKIKWKGNKVEAHFYDIEPCEEHPEGAYEFEVILKEKPATNKIEFTLNTKGLDFFYQPELTQQEIDEGAFRPENVVGSYAVYASENKTNYVGGKEYKVGKVGHIFRPKIIDSIGKGTWGILNIDKIAGILSIEIPQDFLDNAVYPIIIDPTFGYGTVGASMDNGPGDNYFGGSLFTSPADAQTANSITAYIGGYGDSTNAKGVLVLHSNLNIVTNGIGSVVNVPNTPSSWSTSSFSTPPSLSPNTGYVLMVIWETSFRLYYDTGAANQWHNDATNSYASPTNPTDAAHFTYKFSIYVTYTAAPSGQVIWIE